VQLPLRELGRRGFAHAVRQLAGETVAPELLPTRVVIRGSIGPPQGFVSRGGAA